jgi:prespore-specific regulator
VENLLKIYEIKITITGVKIMKTRQDAWTHEDDLLLAETVLRYIREGGTQLEAFEEVGDKLNRTAAACGFRWNAEVRKNFEQAINMAKKQRKERKRALERLKKEMKPSEKNKQPEPAQPALLPAPSVSINIDDCIRFLTNLKLETNQSETFKAENELLKQENENLLMKNKELELKLQNLSEQQATMQEDYQTLVKIMDRARRLVLLEDDETQSPVFRMDKNGNLEQFKNIN